MASQWQSLKPGPGNSIVYRLSNGGQHSNMPFPAQVHSAPTQVPGSTPGVSPGGTPGPTVCVHKHFINVAVPLLTWICY